MTYSSVVQCGREQEAGVFVGALSTTGSWRRPLWGCYEFQ